MIHTITAKRYPLQRQVIQRSPIQGAAVSKWSLTRLPADPKDRGQTNHNVDWQHHEQSEWWSQTGSNRRPHACKARALPTELWPHVWIKIWWAEEDLNLRPHAYQACALTT